MPDQNPQDEYLITIDGEEYQVTAGSVEEARQKAEAVSTPKGRHEARMTAARTAADAEHAATMSEFKKDLGVARDAAWNLIPSLGRHIGSSVVSTGELGLDALKTLVGSPADRVTSQMEFGERLAAAPAAIAQDYVDAYGTHEARDRTLGQDPGRIVMDALLVRSLFGALRKGGGVALNKSIEGADYLASDPARMGAAGAVVGGLTTGSPMGAAAGASSGVLMQGPTARMVRALQRLRKPNAPLAEGPTTPIAPASAGIVLPQARPPAGPSPNVARGMSEAGRPALAEIEAQDQLRAALAALRPQAPTPQMGGQAPTLSDVLRQALEEIRAGEVPTGVELAETGAPSVQFSDAARRVAGIPNALSADERAARATQLARQARRAPAARAARAAELTDATEDFAAEYAARQAHGVGGFSRLPALPPAELDRIKATLDAIMRRRTNPY